MTIEQWNVLFSAATFVVIAITAVAATIQLRHLRASNQLSALVTLLEDWQKPDLQRWVRYSRGGELAEKLKDPAYLQSMPLTRTDRELHPWLHVCDYYEQLGSYVKYGLVDQPSFLDVGCTTVYGLYQNIRPCVERLRASVHNDALYENFEYLAVLSAQWMKAHPNGLYPAGVPRFSELQ